MSFCSVAVGFVGTVVGIRGSTGSLGVTVIALGTIGGNIGSGGLLFKTGVNATFGSVDTGSSGTEDAATGATPFTAFTSSRNVLSFCSFLVGGFMDFILLSHESLFLEDVFPVVRDKQ
jgi:hypothetical protein